VPIPAARIRRRGTSTRTPGRRRRAGERQRRPNTLLHAPNLVPDRADLAWMPREGVAAGVRATAARRLQGGLGLSDLDICRRSRCRRGRVIEQTGRRRPTPGRAQMVLGSFPGTPKRTGPSSPRSGDAGGRRRVADASRQRKVTHKLRARLLDGVIAGRGNPTWT